MNISQYQLDLLKKAVIDSLPVIGGALSTLGAVQNERNKDPRLPKNNYKVAGTGIEGLSYLPTAWESVNNCIKNWNVNPETAIEQVKQQAPRQGIRPVNLTGFWRSSNNTLDIIQHFEQEGVITYMTRLDQSRPYNQYRGGAVDTANGTAFLMTGKNSINQHLLVSGFSDLSKRLTEMHIFVIQPTGAYDYNGFFSLER